MNIFDQMDEKIQEGRKIFQEQLHRLVSGHPDRYMDIVLLANSVKHQLSTIQETGIVDSVIDTPAAVETFLKALVKDNDPGIRSDVAKELGNICHEISYRKIDVFEDIPQSIEEGLISALDDENSHVHKAVTKALKKIGTPSALAAIPSKPWWKLN